MNPSTAPVNVPPYRYPHFQKNEIEKQISDLLSARLIRPSTSPYSSSVLLVKKKDGTWRLCVDYRALNSVTVCDRFPIPTIDELLDELGHASWFSKLDLRRGFHQILMNDDDVEKTAFRTHHGHFEYLVMPFGLCNATSNFQSAMINSYNHSCADSPLCSLMTSWCIATLCHPTFNIWRSSFKLCNKVSST